MATLTRKRVVRISLAAVITALFILPQLGWASFEQYTFEQIQYGAYNGTPVSFGIYTVGAEAPVSENHFMGPINVGKTRRTLYLTLALNNTSPPLVINSYIVGNAALSTSSPEYPQLQPGQTIFAVIVTPSQFLMGGKRGATRLVYQSGASGGSSGWHVAPDEHLGLWPAGTWVPNQGGPIGGQQSGSSSPPTSTSTTNSWQSSSGGQSAN